MAKLGVYFSLCPLIHHRSLLGIHPDEENGRVLVSLGKNMASKFKISDQRQVTSWRTRQKFTSPIIFDRDEAKYVAVFNDNFMRVWGPDEDNLDGLKKLKFTQQIHTAVSCGGHTFIIFRNGNIETLKHALEERKNLKKEGLIDTENEYIVEVLSNNFKNETYIGLLINSNSVIYLIWTKFDENAQKDKFYKILLNRTDFTLNGYLFHADNSSINFLSLWSDGRIFSTELQKIDQDSANIGELFATIEEISCKDYVAMITLDPNYIALYGCAATDEGALLVIYNVQFKVVQSRQPFKLFTNGAKIWKINEHLMFPVGQNLAVIPFHLATEQLAALVGSHRVTFDNDDVSIVQKLQYVKWVSNCELEQIKPPKKLKVKIEEYLTQGLSETQMVEIVTAEVLEKRNLNTIKGILKYFSNIPERNLIDILNLVLTADGENFENRVESDYLNCPKELEPRERSRLIDLILTKSFNEPLILPYLRTTLKINDVINLMQYISFLISEDGHNLIHMTAIQTESKLLEWACAIIDANYQRFLMCRDDKVKDTFLLLKAQIQDELSTTRDLTELLTFLKELKRGRSSQKMIKLSRINYIVKEFPLY